MTSHSWPQQEVSFHHLLGRSAAVSGCSPRGDLLLQLLTLLLQQPAAAESSFFFVSAGTQNMATVRTRVGRHVAAACIGSPEFPEITTPTAAPPGLAGQVAAKMSRTPDQAAALPGAAAELLLMKLRRRRTWEPVGTPRRSRLSVPERILTSHNHKFDTKHQRRGLVASSKPSYTKFLCAYLR